MGGRCSLKCNNEIKNNDEIILKEVITSELLESKNRESYIDNTNTV